MAFKLTAVVAGVVMGLLSGAAHASIVNFSFHTDQFVPGEEITASGTLSLGKFHPVENYYDIIDVTGNVNGSAITGLDQGLYGTLNIDNYRNAIIFDQENLTVNTADGISYYFSGKFAGISAGDVNPGRFEVSSVPLPASAPMFGAALLGLGGLGYAARRKKVAAA